MTDARSRNRWLRAGPALAITALLIAGTGAGCGDDEENNPIPTPDSGGDTPDDVFDGTSPTDGGGDADSGKPGDGTIGTIKAASTKVSSPFDATPDLTGENIYFTGVGTNGPSVFKVAAGGAADPVDIVTPPTPFAGPFGIAISSDGKTLYVADPAASVASDTGAIYSLGIAGGTPTILGGTEGYVPRGLEVNGTDIYFSGNDKADGAPGLFKIPASGGAVTVVAKGAPFNDPSGVAVTKSGDAYVLDTVAAASRLALVIKVSGTTASTFVSDLGVGYPGGIALSQDESAILVSGIDPLKGTDAVYRIVISASPTIATFTTGIDKYGDSAGLHRAKNADIYAWADGLAGGNGTVFVLSK